VLLDAHFWKFNMKIDSSTDALRSLTYSLDACHTGFYFWLGQFTLRIGGVDVDDNPYFYPYIVPTTIGFGFALPNYFSWHTPFDEYAEVTKYQPKQRKGKGFGTCDAR
jgi:hypothetical protein